MVPLCELSEGEQGEIAEIDRHEKAHRHGAKGRGHQGQGRMSDMGLRVGKQVQLLRKQNRGPILLKVDEARIAIGRGLADRIWIRKRS